MCVGLQEALAPWRPAFCLHYFAYIQYKLYISIVIRCTAGKVRGGSTSRSVGSYFQLSADNHSDATGGRRKLLMSGQKTNALSDRRDDAEVVVHCHAPVCWLARCKL